MVLTSGTARSGARYQRRKYWGKDSVDRTSHPGGGEGVDGVVEEVEPDDLRGQRRRLIRL